MNESDTDSESEVEMEAKIERKPKPKSILKTEKKADKKKKDIADGEEDDDEEDEEEESDIALSDLEDMADSDREDLFVKTKLSINNQPALLAALKRIALPRDASVPFATHQTVASSEPTASKIEDISDDLNRELQLYAQSLEAAKKARSLLKAEGVPFSRPKDYFAEMLKDDGHMEKVKAKLVEEATAKKAAAEARKLRDLKKFGKQVQVAKLQERQKQKRETLEKIKALKKSMFCLSSYTLPPPPPFIIIVCPHSFSHTFIQYSNINMCTKPPPLPTERSENGNDLSTNEADLFDVAVDNELNKPGKRSRSDTFQQGGGRSSNPKRAKKDAKFGFGGKKRHGKSGDAVSSGDLSGFNARKMKGQSHGGAQGGGPRKGGPMKTARLGKNKRKAMAGKR